MRGFEFDPDRALWKPGRRSFLFMFGAALVAPMLPGVSETATNDPITPAGWGSTGLKVGDTFTIRGVYAVNPMTYRNHSLEVFRVKAIRGSVVDIDRAINAPLGSLVTSTP